jgi:hypothetical protein
MSTPTTAGQDDLRSRLPDPSQFFPELAGMAGAMFFIPVALIAKPIPNKEPHYSK